MSELDRHTQSFLFLEPFQGTEWKRSKWAIVLPSSRLTFFFLKGNYKIREKWVGCTESDTRNVLARPQLPSTAGESDQDLWPVKPPAQANVCQRRWLLITRNSAHFPYLPLSAYVPFPLKSTQKTKKHSPTYKIRKAQFQRLFPSLSWKIYRNKSIKCSCQRAQKQRSLLLSSPFIQHWA